MPCSQPVTPPPTGNDEARQKNFQAPALQRLLLAAFMWGSHLLHLPGWLVRIADPNP
jgi:hypothetical protein